MRGRCRFRRRLALQAGGFGGGFSLCVLLTALVCHGEVQPFSVVELGPNDRVLERVTEQVLPSGQKIAKKSRVYEIATGMCRNVNGDFVDCNNTVRIFNGAAVAQDTVFPVIFSASPNVAGAVDSEAPDGKRFRCNLLGIALYDPANGSNSVMIAEVQEATGEVQPPNRVYYSNALGGTSPEFGSFDLFYTVELAGWEQFVLIRNKFSLPRGFNPESTRLECWTEFLDPPVPQKRIRTVNGIADETLDFGAITIGPGKAFLLEGAETWSTPVAKSWVQTGGRVFLVEAVPWKSVEAQIAQLPAPALQAGARRSAPAGLDRVAQTVPGRKGMKLPGPRAAAKSKKSMRMASAPMPSTGLVVDAAPLLSGVSLTLEGDKTYLCKSAVLCTNLTIEGGVVVKYTNGASIEVSGQGGVTCLTSEYRPAWFTSVCDTNVGEVLATNALSGYYANTALILHDGSHSLQYIRISYATNGISLDDGQVTVKHSMFTHCNTGMRLSGCIGFAYNVLFYSMNACFDGVFNATVEHATFDICNAIGGYSTNASTYLTNCIAGNVDDWGQGSFYTNQIAWVSDSSCFQTVGGCSHYLAANSPYRNIGVTNTVIGPELRSKTTYPPIVYASGYLITNQDITLTPQAQRDTDNPDLGWHPEPLDYVFSQAYLENAILTITPGTALGFYNNQATSYGFRLGPGGQIIAEGSPTNLVRFVRYSTVQEIANTNWSGRAQPLIRTPEGNVSPPPQLRFRFTDFSVLANETDHINCSQSVSNMSPIRLSDSQVRGGNIISWGVPLNLTNSLFERVYSEIFSFDPSLPFTNYFQNNLFYGGEVLAYMTASTNEFVFRDNLFDKTVLANSSDVANGYNGYLVNSNRLSPTGTTDVVLTNISYDTGPLGRYYLPTNTVMTNLVDAGSVTNAGFKGLYWYASTTNQVLDSATRLNIGLHYVATTNGVPIDTDGDGTPNYLEDANGNGILDSGETDWNSATDAGLRILITRPRNGSVLP